MCDEVVRMGPCSLAYVPDCFKTQGMCDEEVCRESYALRHVPDYFKTREMCDDAVRDDPSSLQYVPDWFVTGEGVAMQHNDAYYCNEDKLIEWYEGYKKRKAQNEKIKEELCPLPGTSIV